jgi:hypothetical protein
MPFAEIAFHHQRPIDPQAERALYTAVGWWPLRTQEEIAQVLGEALAVGAWEGDHLVPFYEEHGFRAFPSQMVMYRKRTIPCDSDNTI